MKNLNFANGLILAAAGTEAGSTEAAPAEVAPVVRIWDRPGSKANDEQAQPPYDAAMADARREFGSKLTELISAHLTEVGAFVTPNNKRDGLLLALTLTCPPVTFRTPDGKEQTTRPWNLNLNAVIQPPDVRAKTTESTPVASAMSWDEMQALVSQNRKARKA